MVDRADGTDPVASLGELLQATARDRAVVPPDLASAPATSYIDTLLSLPLDSLLAEAAVISSQASTVESDLVNLCYREYSTFIAVHKCSSAITSAFDDFSSSLTRLLDAVPALEDECRQFTKATASVQVERARAIQVQDHQDKLFDLLEIPQLMDTCVRNGYYQEALELSTHAASLASRYPANQLVFDVAREVDGVLQLMLAQLLALFREPVKLPSLMKAVNFLRRLRKIDEEDLALAFLIGRSHNFTTHLVALERDRADVVRYIRRFIDVFREHVFDIISQYGTIFLDGASSPILAMHLTSFGEHCVKTLVHFVASNVPRLGADTASLSSILVQLGYCATSFSRVGLDFTALITEPFSTAVSAAFAQSTSLTASKLCEGLRDAGATAPSQVLIAADFLPHVVESTLSISAGKSFDDIPADLAQLPLLAVFVNSQLSALNSLRLLAPHRLRPLLTSTLSSSLLSCTVAISQYIRASQAAADAPITPSSHRRTPSSPRAALVRRNSESQMTPEARIAQRKEARRACWTFADAWVNIVCPLLLSALGSGVYDGPSAASPDLDRALQDLKTWLGEHVETATNGDSDERGPATPRITNGTLPATPAAIPEEDERDTTIVTNGRPLISAHMAFPDSADNSRPADATASSVLLPAPPIGENAVPATTSPAALPQTQDISDGGARDDQPETHDIHELQHTVPLTEAITVSGAVEEMFMATDSVLGSSDAVPQSSTSLDLSVPLPAVMSDISDNTAQLLEAELELKAAELGDLAVTTNSDQMPEADLRLNPAPSVAEQIVNESQLLDADTDFIEPEEKMVAPNASIEHADSVTLSNTGVDPLASHFESTQVRSSTPPAAETDMRGIENEAKAEPTNDDAPTSTRGRDTPPLQDVAATAADKSTIVGTPILDDKQQAEALTAPRPVSGASPEGTVESPSVSTEPSRAPSPDQSNPVPPAAAASAGPPVATGGGSGAGAAKKKKKKGKK